MVCVLLEHYFDGYKRKLYTHVDLDKLYSLFKKHVKPIEKIKIDVRKSIGYIIAEDVYAKYDRPLKNISHVDGFAVRSDDVFNASQFSTIKLKIVKNIDPRKADTYILGRGETVFVETGYPIPVNADAVIPVENVEVKDEYIIVDKPVYRYYQVFLKATDFKQGELAIPKGTRITPLHVKILMDLGYSEVFVYRKPRISILNIGSELVDSPFNPESENLPASTMYLDTYSLTYYGGEIVDNKIIPDDPGLILEAVKNSLENSDVVITIGGVSMGPRDYTWMSIVSGFERSIYWRGVKIFPGRATSGFIIDGKPVINQPGLPLSSLSCLILVITPLINYLQGGVLKPSYPCFEVKLMNDISFKTFIDHYKLAFLKVEDGKASMVEMKGSYYLKTVLHSNSFTVLTPGVETIRKDSYIDACIYPPLHVFDASRSLF